ncbi:hypothetical protein ASF84_17445 [Pseudomonas sp. Leaf127]|uniref:hypothetical protein n=1 Tax=Pseudomonas sp. Leaf127 TaxID=1736267 RepID=UPI0007034D1A|nr:hypothetical protein [Pseudomonas sp. Leaf127]KQQ53600.1 hypothetical protein ASF84_17445 [Pseudomonas sp. Leaf127]
MNRIRRSLRRSIVFLLLVLTCGAAAWWAVEQHEKVFRLSFVPDALGVTAVTYFSEESWGFGPGGNESGIRVYPLPPTTAIRAGAGLSFFKKLPANPPDPSRHWRGSYQNWQETPVSRTEKRWPSEGKNQPMKTYDYLCNYGFCTDVDPSVISEVDAIINAPGSYYAFGRIGVIIVSPSKRLVVYLFNG